MKVSDDSIIGLFKKGYDIAFLSSYFSRPKEEIRAILKRHGHLADEHAKRPERKPLPDEEIEVLYLAGYHISGLADMFGVSRWTITARLKKRNVTLRTRSEVARATKSKATEHALIVSQYLDGVPIRELAKEHGIKEHATRLILQKNGVRIPQKKRGPKPVLTVEQKEIILDLYGAGKTMQTIAEYINVSVATVCRYLQEAKKWRS